jgi:hypothetical protein
MMSLVRGSERDQRTRRQRISDNLLRLVPVSVLPVYLPIAVVLRQATTAN